MQKKSVTKVVMFCCAVVFLALSLLGFNQYSKSKTKDTPSQIGSKGTISSTVKGYTIDELVNEADLIATVKIKEWLKETNEPIQKTFFNATLIDNYKSRFTQDKNEITIMQRGNSEFTVKNYPLFKKNDTLVLFLKKATDMDNTYWILGEHTTVLKSCIIDNSEYFVKEVGDFPELKEIQITDSSDKLKIKNFIKEKQIEFTSLNDYSDIPQSFSKEKFNKKIKEYIK